MSRTRHGVHPREMCRQHVLGEHKEVHQVRGTVNAGIRLGKSSLYVRVDLLEKRHDLLAAEMLRRGWNHSGPLVPQEREPRGLDREPISAKENRIELGRRCAECAYRMAMGYREEG